MATWGSRFRSSALTAPRIDPIRNCPSTNSTSVPLIRGEPSRRRVAMVRCLRETIRARTRGANSGSAASNSAHDATEDQVIDKTGWLSLYSALPGGAGFFRLGWGLGRLDDLAFDVDLDFVADDELAVQHHVEAHAEVLAVDLRLSRVADAVAHVRVIELAVLHDVERDRLGGCLERQVAGDFVAISPGVLDLGALESHRRIFVDLEEIG